MEKRKEKKEKEFRTKHRLTENNLIVLSLPEAETPKELLTSALRQGGFVYPLAKYDSDEMPKPPMKIELSSRGFKAGNIYVLENGKICVHFYEFYDLCKKSGGEKNAIEIIRKDIELLPKLWQWAMDIRREQDRMFARICAMLPGWKIVGLESFRFRFWRTGFHGYSNTTSRIRFLENEGVPLTPPSKEIHPSDLIEELRGLWDETEGEKNRKRKKDEKDEKERKKAAKKQEKEYERRLVRIAAILKKNGLLN